MSTKKVGGGEFPLGCPVIFSDSLFVRTPFSLNYCDTVTVIKIFNV